MLDRDIQIVADLLLAVNRLNQLIGNLLRVTVLNPYPINSRNPRQTLQKLGHGFLSIQIHAIESSFLGYQNQLLHPLSGQFLRFPDQVLHGNAAVWPAQVGDNTVSTALIAAFRDFQIGVMTAGSKNSGLSRAGKFLQAVKAGHMGLLFLFHQALYHRDNILP